MTDHLFYAIIHADGRKEGVPVSKRMLHLVRVARGFSYLFVSDGISMPFFDSVQAL